MYTVLLVDDEKIILDTLKSGIHWQQFGVDKILTGTDGVQALEIMKQQIVDLLITDIRMPHMDGLELLAHVRKLYPHTHCVLLTAYSEFSYARQALRLGVENYLLKPFDREELEETIEKALDNIYINNQNTDSLFLTNILLRWINGTINNNELSERAVLLDINLYLPYYSVVCIKKKQEHCHIQPFCSAVMERLSRQYEVQLLWDQKGHNTFIIGSRSMNSDQLVMFFSECAKEMDMDSLIALSVGKVVKSYKEVSLSYQSACRLLDAVDLSIDQPIILKNDMPSNPDNDIIQKEILTIFNLPESEKEQHYQSLIWKLLMNNRPVNYNLALSRLFQCIIQLFLQEFPLKNEINDQIYNRGKMNAELDSKEDFILSVTEIMDYCYLLYKYSFNQLSPIIQHAIGYIHRHYAESLSIKEYCARNKMSTPYFGNLFKKETGMFYNNYLSQYRICCSVQLLRETDLKINDIALRVGFCSTSYFIQHFKKQTGFSPIKYRALQMDNDI